MLLTNLCEPSAESAPRPLAIATLVADDLTRVAAIVNPIDIEQTLDYLQAQDLRLRYIFSTSNPPIDDLLSAPRNCASPSCRSKDCRLELAYRTGAKGYKFHATQSSESTFALLKPGDVIEFGMVRLKVVQTDSNELSLLVYDLAVDDRVPQAQWIDATKPDSCITPSTTDQLSN